ncbi:hypothetical protein EDD18DRAFT_1110068 [Armillaria luteobubalina]|uniref:Uncharacterized protein n=1 Tax=Armillaria luteobubalina TaxID=153913 RepID=A0AA39PTD5_9AGAR|nr:hypothetical protein EDD18DRAFT_1110068 [Armillaria luteobubalina]
MFTQDRFDADLTVRKSKDRRAKLRELLKMSMSEDESSSDEEDDESSDSDNDSDYKGRKHRNKRLSKNKKGKKNRRTLTYDSSDDVGSEKSTKRQKEQANHWREKLEEKGKYKAGNKKETQPEKKETDEVEELIGRPTMGGMMCYGCGSPEHMICQCPLINEMIRSGQTTVRTNHVSINMMGTYYSDEDEGASDNEYYDYYTSDQEDDDQEDSITYQRSSRAYAVERHAKGIHQWNQDRRAILGESLANPKEGAMGKGRGVTKASPSNPYGTRLNPNKGRLSGTSTKPQKERGEKLPPLPSVPIQARMPRIDNSKDADDIEMIDLESPAIVGQRAEGARLNLGNEVSKPKVVKGPLIAEKYSPNNLIKSTLDTQITLPIGELMAHSTELHKQMIKELQTRTIRIEDDKENGVHTSSNIDKVARVHNLTSRSEGKKPEEQASLIIIKVIVGLGDRKLWVNAIVDSGSEVNIISRTVAKELNKDYPVMPLEEA